MFNYLSKQLVVVTNEDQSLKVTKFLDVERGQASAWNVTQEKNIFLTNVVCIVS